MSSISSIDSDELDLCDIETTSDMAPDSVLVPPLEENGTHVGIGPVSSTALGEQDMKEEPLRSPLEAQDDVSIHGLPDTQAMLEPSSLLSVDSLLEMVRLIPGLTLVDGVYHVRGSITDEARHSICAYANRIGEFTLTDAHDDERLGPDVFLCLAQLQAPGRPLFPSLSRLRISNAGSCLDYLRLFISPSIRAIDVVGMHESWHTSFLNFVTAALDDIPDLESLTLGPGRIPPDVLHTLLRFRCLRHLRLVDSALSLDYQLLEAIGRLEVLESFSIDSQAAFYTPSPLIYQPELAEARRCILEESRQRETEELSRRKTQLAKDLCLVRGNLARMEEEMRLREQSLPRPEGKEDSVVQPSQCSKRSRCNKYNSSTLVEKHLRLCSPCLMEKMQYTRNLESGIVEQEQEEHKRSRPIPILQEADVPIAPVLDLTDHDGGATLYPSLTSLTVRGNILIMQDIVERVSSPSLNLLQLALGDSETLKLITPISRRVASIIDMVEKRWSDSITHIVLQFDGTSSISSTLPKDSVRKLLCLSALEHLDILGWTLSPSAVDGDDSGFSIPLMLETSKLRTLRLPDNFESSLSLPDLARIEKSIPNLVSLECTINNSHQVPVYPAGNLTKGPPHNLDMLYLGSASHFFDTDHMLEIAAYVDMLFPNLKSIAVPAAAQDRAQWRILEAGVKMCQKVRARVLERCP